MGLDALQRRVATGFPEPLRDPLRYLRSLMPAEAAKAARLADQLAEAAAPPGPQSAAARELQARRQAQWLAEWLRRRRQRCAEEIAALAPERQAELVTELLAEFQRLGRHPSLSKRLQTAGWQHPMVSHEMIRFYAEGAHGEHWDKPSDGDLLAIAAEGGESPEPPESSR